jgi:TPR repeat protein
MAQSSVLGSSPRSGRRRQPLRRDRNTRDSCDIESPATKAPRSGPEIHTRWLLGLFVLLCTSGAHAGLKEGLEAALAHDYERCFREMLPLAEAGHPVAQFQIARLYQTGRFVAKDAGKALEWYSRSGQGGNSPAQVNLAIMFRRGEGTGKDPKAALMWFRRAAEQGEETAYMGLADMYETGEGVEPDPASAMQWLKKAAEKDYPPAEYQLGLRYWRGQSLAQDFDQAHAWLEKSATQNFVPALVSLGMMFLGDGRPPDPVTACTYLKLARQLGVKRQQDVGRLEVTLRQRCDSLDAVKQREVSERVLQWKPHEVWFEREQKEFQELIRRAGEEDAKRAKGTK